MAGKKGRYYGKEERTPSESRLIGLTKAQRASLDRASTEDWMTASELRTTNAAAKTLTQKGLLESQLVGDKICYRRK